MDKLYNGKSVEEVIVKYMEDSKRKLEDAEKAKIDNKQKKLALKKKEEEKKGD